MIPDTELEKNYPRTAYEFKLLREIQRLKAEIVRLKEYEWKYKDLCD